MYKGSYEPAKLLMQPDGTTSYQFRYLGCNYTVNFVHQTLEIDQLDLIDKILNKWDYKK